MLLRSNILHQTINTAINFLYPTQCRICKNHFGIETVPYMCDKCWGNIDFVERPWCDLCGLPKTDGTCDKCNTKPPRFGKLRTIAFYEGAVQQAIHIFKFERRLYFAKFLIQLIIDNVPSDCDITDYDYIIPIPIHKRRLNERGFNQCFVLCKGISKKFKVEVKTDVLTRRKNTSPQSSLDRDKRMQNIIGAFGLSNEDQIQGKRILLFDDVFTTGATVSEAVNVLWSADPTEVDVLTLARTPVTEL